MLFSTAQSYAGNKMIYFNSQQMYGVGQCNSWKPTLRPKDLENMRGCATPVQTPTEMPVHTGNSTGNNSTISRADLNSSSSLYHSIGNRRFVVNKQLFFGRLVSSGGRRFRRSMLWRSFSSNDQKVQRHRIPPAVLTLDVGGRIFRIRRSQLLCLPGTRLGKLAYLLNIFYNERVTTDRSIVCSSINSFTEATDSALNSSSNTSKCTSNMTVNLSSKQPSDTEWKVRCLCDDADPWKGVFFFDRDAKSFPSILDYYRTGTLHMPGGICVQDFQEDLFYWSIEMVRLLPIFYK